MALTIFVLLAIIAVAGAVGVVVFRNPIFSALNLALAMLSVAGLFAQLDAHFLAAVRIIVYAGAVVVLVLFVLMLLNSKVEPPSKKEVIYQVSGTLVGGCFLLAFVPTLYELFQSFPSPRGPLASLATEPVEGTVSSVGMMLYTKYLFTFEIASILIMAALVGAILLAKRRKAVQKH